MAVKERNRPVQFKIMLTENEKVCIQERASSVNMKPSAYARKIMINGAIIYRDATLYSKCVKELNAIGKNINQIAHNTNALGGVIKTDVDQLKSQYERLKDLYVKLLGEIT